MLYLFRNHLGKIVFCLLLGLGGMALYLYHARPTYASTVLLEVGAKQNAGGTDADALDTLKTVELKIASQPVLLGVIKSQRLADSPEFALRGGRGFHSEVGFFRQLAAGLGEGVNRLKASPWLAKFVGGSADAATDQPLSDLEMVQRFASRVRVGLVRGSRLISVKVEDHDPEKAQQLAQSIINEFFQQAREERSRNSASTRDMLLAEAKRVGNEFKKAEEKLEDYRHQHQAVSLQERQNIVVERLRDLNQQVTAAKNARLHLETEQERVRHLSGTAPDELLSLRAIADFPEIVDLRKQITLQEAQVATLAQRFGPLHPTMIQAQSQRGELRSLLRGAIQKAGARIVQSYESAKTTEQALQKSLAEQEQAALELDRIAIPYHALERELQANATTYQKILDDLKQFDVTHGLTSANNIDGIDIHVVEPPLVPLRPSAPRPLLLLSVAAVAGLFLGCGFALGARALDTSINSVDNAESTLGVSVLATVPRSRHHRLERRPITLRFPASAQAEAFRSLRTSLSMLDSEDERRCVLFTSAVPGEGKSFCSLNCAAALAQQGTRTLLIDGDFRRPSLRRLFSEPNGQPELTACLADPDLLPKAIERTPVENLFCLGDWYHQSGSAERVAQDGLREIIRRALDTYDRVVIDTAPLMAVSDTLYIARNVPTICLVIYAGKTPRQVARRALKLLEEVAKRPATGLVLNKVSSRSAEAHYYYYYKA